MLVLTRKAGESIRIGKDIDVVVLEVVNGRAKLGLSAPRSVPVRRSELREIPHGDKRPTDHRALVTT